MQQLDARHRAHARVEDQVRTTKDTGPGHLPSKSWQINTGWCHAVTIAADLLAWFKLLALTGELAHAEPKTLRYRLLAVPARLTRGQRRRWLRLPRHWPWAEALATAIDKIRQLPLPTPQPG
ncbi:transposase [Natronosporangium hydrolyticum]|uniref:transposase n=1 Tax=Natronosporangium hydrolyticum TaxID=2811111 RepID=UPI001EFA13C3|nr:transposase [Natronosporangium hydrolyticum]